VSQEDGQRTYALQQNRRYSTEYFPSDGFGSNSRSLEPALGNDGNGACPAVAVERQDAVIASGEMAERYGAETAALRSEAVRPELIDIQRHAADARGRRGLIGPVRGNRPL
jgi:hypothetical protein